MYSGCLRDAKLKSDILFSSIFLSRNSFESISVVLQIGQDLDENSNFQCQWNDETPLVLLHPSYLCDGHAQCPLRDDELDCDVSCRDGFICLGGAVKVTDYNTTQVRIP